MSIHSRFCILLLLISLGGLSATAEEGAAEALRLGGCGGLYLYAEAGPLWVEIHKQDRNVHGRKTTLQAILVGPDRKPILQKCLPDAPGKGKAGSLQRLRLETEVQEAGVYGVNITVSADRYGEDIYWGFQTNCDRYLVECSRGHKDKRHEEPVIIHNPDRAGEVCFLPRASAFKIEASNLAEGVSALRLVDAAGGLVATIPVTENKEAVYQLEAGERSKIPWRLQFPKYQAQVQIDGLTRWDEGPNMNLSLWTPHASSWFDFHTNRWLLTPYSRKVYGKAGEKRTVSFTLNNNGGAKKEGFLSIAKPGLAAAEEQAFALEPYASKTVPIEYTIPGAKAAWEGKVRVKLSDATSYTTYSSVTLVPGKAPAESPLKMPVVLQPYQHENAQFGYLPEYPTTNQIYFDLENRAYCLSKQGIYVKRQGSWELNEVAQLASAERMIPIKPLNSKIAFDQDNDVYVLGNGPENPVLLHSQDQGLSFKAYPIPVRGSFDIEQFSGHNHPTGPPPFLCNVRTAKDPNLIWRSLNNLELFCPEKDKEGALLIGEPVRISDKSLGVSLHSGIPSTIVSKGKTVYLTWGEATDPTKKVPGVPTYVVSYDRETQVLGKAKLVGYGPANDVHNTPCITMDSKGFLHILIGTHGRSFSYVKSLEADHVEGSWSEAKLLGADLRQTYVGLVCDEEDTLHLFFRLWKKGAPYFSADETYATLAYMSKKPGETWSEPKPMVIAAFSGYSIFYHRLTIDRNSALYLSYDYWSTHWFYRMDHRGKRRALISSPDHGQSWRLVNNDGI